MIYSKACSNDSLIYFRIPIIHQLDHLELLKFPPQSQVPYTSETRSLEKGHCHSQLEVRVDYPNDLSLFKKMGGFYFRLFFTVPIFDVVSPSLGVTRGLCSSRKSSPSGHKVTPGRGHVRNRWPPWWPKKSWFQHRDSRPLS